MWCHTAQQYSSADPIKDIQIVTVFNLNAWSAQYTEHVELFRSFGNSSINMASIEFHPINRAPRDDGIRTWLDVQIIVSFEPFEQRYIVNIIPDTDFGCRDIQIVDQY